MLGLLVAVALFAGWQAQELDTVQTRKAYVGMYAHGRWDDRLAAAFKVARPPSAKSATIPFWRSWLGDEPVDFIVLPKAAVTGELEEGSTLFPEARIYRQAAGGAILEK
ncbi:MAG: hypothetical protein HYX69_11775 [Planctomycetia bacterium]|nr:hypothetical protein [Planctomycetia bacterium]